MAAHHGQAVQHAPVNASLVKVTLVLGEADVVQPPWKQQRSIKAQMKAALMNGGGGATHGSPSCDPVCL